MKKADLLALAARVEAAQGADRELDAAIMAVSGLTMSMVLEVPRYTASLDAAASLVRLTECFIAAMGDIAADGLPGVCLCISTYPPKHVWGIGAGGNSDEGEGRLARAMTAAALRAMAEEAGDE